jgi:hypothetical protein
MSNLINIAIAHEHLDDFVFTKMPTVPRIGEQVGFWRDDKRTQWIIGTIINIIYECDYERKYDDSNLGDTFCTMIELTVTGSINE